MSIDEQYLYQCLTRRRQMSAAEAFRVERESGGQVKRWSLRWADWHLIWPDLIHKEGAPPVPDAAQVEPAQPQEAAHGRAAHAA